MYSGDIVEVGSIRGWESPQTLRGAGIAAPYKYLSYDYLIKEPIASVWARGRCNCAVKTRIYTEEVRFNRDLASAKNSPSCKIRHGNGHWSEVKCKLKRQCP